MGDSFYEQLIEDSAFLRAERRLDTELVDKIILQLNRIYPQILTDKEATKFRNLDVPTSLRVGELLTHLQRKGEEACREFYRALHLHVEEVYYSLPTRLRLRDSLDPLTYPHVYHQRHVLNDRGPLFFLGCFSVAVGMALLYYYSEAKVTGGSRALGMAALGLKRKAQEVLIWYTEESLMKYHVLFSNHSSSAHHVLKDRKHARIFSVTLFPLGLAGWKLFGFPVDQLGSFVLLPVSQKL